MSSQLRSKDLIKLHSLCMIDIIEDTAIAALERMPAILLDFPNDFDSVEQAVEWNLNSAHSHHAPGMSKTGDIVESCQSQLRFNSCTNKYEWIVDLKLLASYWSTWFADLTESFLNFSDSRLLVLANTDYMDKKMIIAQMQGKFQLAIVRDSGHAIHEDHPEQLADLIAGLVMKHLKLLHILRLNK